MPSRMLGFLLNHGKLHSTDKWKSQNTYRKTCVFGYLILTSDSAANQGGKDAKGGCKSGGKVVLRHKPSIRK